MTCPSLCGSVSRFITRPPLARPRGAVSLGTLATSVQVVVHHVSYLAALLADLALTLWQQQQRESRQRQDAECLQAREYTNLGIDHLSPLQLRLIMSTSTSTSTSLA
jgi:hypothetical protein